MPILSLSEFQEWKKSQRKTLYGKKKKRTSKRFKLNKQDARDYALMLNHLREI